MSAPIGTNMHAQNLYGMLTLIALAMITPCESRPAPTRARVARHALPARAIVRACASHLEAHALAGRSPLPPRIRTHAPHQEGPVHT
eukprot:421474-Prymnesium_polylepis.1